MTIANKLRESLKNWLNGGDSDTIVNREFEAEIQNAIDEVRPEIKEICRASVRQIIDDLKVTGLVFNKDRVAKLLNDQLECTIDTYEDEIQEIIYDQLRVELKTVKIINK